MGEKKNRGSGANKKERRNGVVRQEGETDQGTARGEGRKIRSNDVRERSEPSERPEVKSRVKKKTWGKGRREKRGSVDRTILMKLRKNLTRIH